MSPIDARRLARAVHLDVVRLDRERWQVTGGTASHVVARTPEGMTCDCRDADMGRHCKHQLAVRLTLGNRGVLLALRDLVAVPR